MNIVIEIDTSQAYELIENLNYYIIVLKDKVLEQSLDQIEDYKHIRRNFKNSF